MKITSCSGVSEKSVGYYELLWTHTLFFFPDSDHCSGLKLLPRAGHRKSNFRFFHFHSRRKNARFKMGSALHLGGRTAEEPDRPWCFPFTLLQNTLCRGFWAVVYAGAHPRGTHPHTAGQYTSTALRGNDWSWGPSLLLPACMFQSIKISFIWTSKCKH